MSSKLNLFFALAASVACSAMAQPSKPATPPDKQNLSYALGMNLALDTKNTGVEIDPAVVAQAIEDVLQNKPTALQDNEVLATIKKAETVGQFRLASKHIAEGETFLATNATAPGITVLPDGVQYRVIQEGAGTVPKMVEILTLKFRGTWIDGKEFKHNDRLEIPMWACTRGLQEAISKMKVGSRWQIFVPYSLAYGLVGERAQGYGSTLVYDLELLNAESETAHPNQHHSAGRLGHTLDEDLLPDKFRSAAQSQN